MRNLRWYIAGLLMLATTICYLDRQALTIASVVIKPKFHLSNEDYAKILLAYQLTYGFGQPLAGRFIDWINTRRGFAISVLAWSLASMAHVFGKGLLSFSILRGVLGITEAGNFPGATKAVSEWFPPKERSTATGIFNCGAGLGAILAPILMAAWLIPHYGWKAAFVVTSSLGLFWVWGWLLLYHSPGKHPKITQEELAYIEEVQSSEETALEPAKGGRGVWREVLMTREFWALGLGRFLTDPVWGFYLYWLPGYLKDARGFDLVKIGMFAWIPFLFSDFGSIAGGALSSYFVKRGYPVIKARKIAMCICASLMPVAIPAFLARDPLVAIFCISIAAFGHQSWAASMLTLPADMFPKRLVACASGFTATVSTVGGLLFTYYIGYAIDHWGYSPVFIPVAFMHPLAAIVVVTLLGSRRRNAPQGI